MNPESHETSHLPGVFRITYGCWELSQQLEWQDGKLVYRPNVWSSESEVMPLFPTKEAWQEFWAVAEGTNVWRWQKEYNNPLVLDGLQWSLEISYQGHQVVCEGSNAFPGWDDGPEFPADCEFGRFLEAIQRMTGGRFRWEAA